jgi:hypothetical protein
MIAKKLEECLYRMAKTKEEYMNISTLKKRLQLIAFTLDPMIGTKPKKTKGSKETLKTKSHKDILSPGTGKFIDSSYHSASIQQRIMSLRNKNQALEKSMEDVLIKKPLSGSEQGNCYIAQLQPNLISNIVTNNPASSSSHKKFNDKFLNTAVSKKDRKKIIRQQQQRLILLRHASRCNRASCSVKFCTHMVTLWNHMKKCRDKHCSTPHCLSSRCVLNHYKICKDENRTATCEVCAPVMEVIRIQDTELEQRNNNNPSPLELLNRNFVKYGDSNVPKPSYLTRTGHHHKIVVAEQLKRQQEFASLKHLRAAHGGDNNVLMKAFIDAKNKNDEPHRNEHMLHLLSVQNKASDSLPQCRNDRHYLKESSIDDIDTNAVENLDVIDFNLFDDNFEPNKDYDTKIDDTFNLDLFDEPKIEISKKRGIDEIGGDTVPKMLRTDSENLDFFDVPKIELSKKRGIDEIGGGSTDAVPKMLRTDSENSLIGLFDFKQTDDIKGSLKLHEYSGTNQIDPELIHSKMLPLVKQLLDDPVGWLFKDPVDPKDLGIPDYFDVIKKPMNLGLIQERLTKNMYYKSFEVVINDVKLVFDNAIEYNGKDSDVGQIAMKLLESFSEECNKIKW